jgi:Zn-dependent peptidase ImmA (M78 family)
MTSIKKIEQIQKSTSRLLQLADVNEPAIPVERMARLLGAQLRYVPFEGDLSGLLSQEQGRIIIGVNELHPKTRQRFTIAHELGHLELHHPSELHIDHHYRILLRSERSSQAIDPEEIEANAFAAELLMPQTMLEKDIGEQAIDYEDDEMIRELAHRYKVSLQAMIFRLTNLGFISL